jgi:ankyrin repeat protein
MKKFVVTATLILTTTALLVSQGSQSANEALWQAAREGDTAGITAALGKGADVNAKSRYDVTALFFAATSGRLEAVKLLVARGADVNVQDTFYRTRAAEMAITNGHTDVTI